MGKEGHIGPTCSLFPFSIRWTSMETLHLWHWEKKSRRSVRRMFFL